MAYKDYDAVTMPFNVLLMSAETREPNGFILLLAI